MEPEEAKNIRQLTKNIIMSLMETSQESDALRELRPYKGIEMETHYRRPTTIVVLKEKQGRIGVGWSKVCRPDKWDEEKGEGIALARAAQDLSQHIYRSTVSMG